MKVEELRIGNIVKCEEVKQFRVDEILWVEHLGYTLRMRVGVNRESTFDMPLRDAEPIPITDEMLIKCGFTNGVKEHGFFKLYKQNNCVAWGVNDDDQEKFILIDNDSIKSVHQLQNIYFALTGKELKIEF